MISFKGHSLTLFGLWYQRVLFAPEFLFLFSVVVTWSTDSPTHYMVVSLAYRNEVAVLTAFGRSLVYNAKSMGPSMEPCGILWFSQRVRHELQHTVPIQIGNLLATPVNFPWFQSCTLACEEGLGVKRNQIPSGSLWILCPQLICYQFLVAKFQSGGWVIALSISLFGRHIGCQWRAVRCPRKHVSQPCPLHMILKSCWVHLARRGDDNYSLP